MPNDIWYGADSEIRIGRRADVDTPPTAWLGAEFLTLNPSPTQEWRERAKLGAPGARNVTLDPIKPRKGFARLPIEVVLDMDSRMVPLWLRACLGAPATTGSAPLLTHTWLSGKTAEQYFDIQIKVGANDVRIYEAVTLSSLSFQVAGENTQDFNLNLSLVGLRKRRVSAFEGSAPTAAPAEAPMLRALFELNDVAATSILSASMNWDRQLLEGIYLSQTPTVSSNRPNGGQHSGSCSFRAVGAAFDQLEEEDTPVEAAVNFLGVVADHRIRFEHPQVLLAPSGVPINGPGLVERSFSWSPFQVSDAPALRIAVTNNVAAYA